MSKAIDWSGVSVDTKILVWQNDREDEKYRRYFKDFYNSNLYVYPDGLTSYTFKSIEVVPAISIWENGEIYKGDEW